MVRIYDTYAEASEGLFLRVLVTAERGHDSIYDSVKHVFEKLLSYVSELRDSRWDYLWADELMAAASRATATPAMVVGRPESGIERIGHTVSKTPDRREGVVLQFWGSYNPRRQLEEQVRKLYEEFSIRVRQDILSTATTRLFNHLNEVDTEIVSSIDTMEHIGKCGGGCEKVIEKYGREMISVPLMAGQDFEIEKKLQVGKGVSTNFWILGKDEPSARKAAKAAVAAIHGDYGLFTNLINKLLKKIGIKYDEDCCGVITSFYHCPSGSCAENYPPIGPPTNRPYCPTLKKDSEVKSMLREDENSVYEIVIDAMDLHLAKKAMRRGILAAKDKRGVVAINAGNYEGKIGNIEIHLRDLFPDVETVH